MDVVYVFVFCGEWNEFISVGSDWGEGMVLLRAERPEVQKRGSA